MAEKKNSGQIAIIVLLVMVVLLTIGLAVVARSITDVKISEDEKTALRAFSAAEAGIEEVLKGTLIEGSYEYDVGDLTANVVVDELNNSFGIDLLAGESLDVILEGSVPFPTQMTVDWVKTTSEQENPGTCTEANSPASLEVTIFNNNAGTVTMRKCAFNGCNLSNGLSWSTTVNNCTDAAGASGYLRRLTVSSLDSNDRIIRVKPLYNRATLNIALDQDLSATQLYQLVSKSVAEGGKVGAFEVKKTIPALVPIFDYVLFSGGDLTKT